MRAGEVRLLLPPHDRTGQPVTSARFSGRSRGTFEGDALLGLTHSWFEKMKRAVSAKILILCAVAVSLVGAITVVALGGAQAVRGSVQLAVFPLVLLLFSALTLKGVRLPRALIGLSAIGVLCGAIVRYSDVGLEPGAFGIARFDSDPLENTTRIFRDRARGFMGEKALTKLGVIGIDVRSEREAREALKERPLLTGIVWGAEPWVTISIEPAAPVSLASLPLDSFAQKRLQELGVRDLQILSQVPEVGVSKGLDRGTSEFIGRLLRVVPNFPAALRGDLDDTELELQLRSAVLVKAFWTSSRHLAVPKWMLGTLHLMRAVSGPEVSWGELLCAEASIRSARILAIKSGAPPSLQAAILNNEAILQILKAEYSPDPARVLSAARGSMVKAVHLKKRSPLASLEPTYWDPILFNMKAVGSVVPATKKQRR